jgi:uncharacterized membrane protein YfcA
MSVVCFIVVISFVATLVRSTFGFGESLVAVPLLALAIPIDVAVPLAVLMSIVAALVVVIQDHRSIHLASARALIVSATLGIPLGLGVLIALYSAYSLLSRHAFHLEKDDRRWLFGCGFLSGVLGGAGGLNGPPLVVYGNLRRWSPQQFRATAQAYFLPVSLLGFLGYAAKGLATRTVAHHFLLCLPAVLAAILVGRHLNRRLTGTQYYKYIFMGLIAISAVLIAVSI